MKAGSRFGLAGAVVALAMACGCANDELFNLVVPEQRHLDLREPNQLPPVPIPQTLPPQTVSTPPPDAITTDLTLDEALRVALANSAVVRVLAGTTAVSSGQTIYDTAITNTTIDEARAAFDPVVTANNAFNRTETPTAVFDPTNPTGVSITGTRVDDYTLGLGIMQKNPLGGTLSANYALNVDRFTPGPAPLNPQERSAWTLSYTQPLLQGAGIAYNVAPIIIARINTERSYFQFKNGMQDMVRGVIEAYWNVVFARTDVWARTQQVEQGEVAYARAEARKRQGFATSADVAQATVALSNFKATLIASQANLLQREAALRNILGLAPMEPPLIMPITPPTTVRFDPNWEEVLHLAEQQRPDIIELKLVLEADQQLLIRARNEALPQLNANALYRWNGLEGETPAGQHIGTSGGQFTDWTLGVNFSVPLGLRQGRAGLRRAELVIMRDQTDLQQVLHAASHTLATNVRNLASFYKQYEAYKETRAAARINLEQQVADFRAGRGIFLNVLQAITDWGNAVSAEAQTLALYNIELANLEFNTGTILESHGVRFFEERFGSIGPLGCLCDPVCYPSATTPGVNVPKYPVQEGPPEKALESEKPKIQSSDVPTTAPAPGVPDGDKPPS